MTIYSGNLDLEGDRPTDSFDTSLSDVFENSLSHNVFGGVRGAADIGELREANAPTLDQATAAMNAGDKEAEMELRGPAHGVGTLHDFGTGQSAAPPPEIPMADAKQQVKGAGLERELTLPDQPTIRQNVLGIMMQRARDRAETASILSRAPTGAGALDFGTSMIAQSLDPINIAAAFIPIVGEARYAKLMESAGESFLARAGVRTGVGFAQGAVFSAATQPIEYYAATQEGRDYGMSDALRSVMMGGMTFGAMHFAGGAAADIYRSANGRALFPFGPGEPAATTSDALPSRVHEDVLRGAIAQMVQEKPVVAAEHLIGGAASDPRVAESLAVLRDESEPPEPSRTFETTVDINGERTVIRGGPRARPESTWSLFESLAAQGGLRPDPELNALFGGKNPFVPGFGSLIRKDGMSLDRAREAAVGAGYLHDEAEQHGGLTESTINHLLDALDRQARGDRVYRAGQEPATGARVDRDEEMHAINTEIDGAWSDAGIEPKTIDDKLRSRVVEMMDKEGVRDPLVALERATMEETYYGKARGEAESLPETIPGWDDVPGRGPVSDEPGSAPAGGRGTEGEPQPGTAGAGAGPRPVSAGDRTADVRELASRPGPTEQPGAVAAFKAAEKLPEMPPRDSPKSAQLAEAQAVQAEAMWNEAAKYLPPEQRQAFEDAFAASERDSADRAAIIQQGAACLMAAVV